MQTSVKELNLLQEAVEKGIVARICSKDLSTYILEYVFFGKSYELLQPPCGRRQFYEKYREFFWMLDKAFS